MKIAERKRSLEASLSAERLRELVTYDPSSGHFTWKITINNKSRKGMRVGCANSHAYHLIGIDGRLHVAHKLAWLYMTGAWPDSDIDHENTNKKDNRWSNLRLASRSRNMANTGPRRDNTSGFKGVSWVEKRSKWMAQIRVNGRNRFLGYFICPEEAHAAYMTAAKDAFGEFARAE